MVTLHWYIDVWTAQVTHSIMCFTLYVSLQYARICVYELLEYFCLYANFKKVLANFLASNVTILQIYKTCSGYPNSTNILMTGPFYSGHIQIAHNL